MGQVEVERKTVWDLMCDIMRSQGWFLKVGEIIFTGKEFADLNKAWCIGICKPLPANQTPKAQTLAGSSGNRSLINDWLPLWQRRKH